MPDGPHSADGAAAGLEGTVGGDARPPVVPAHRWTFSQRLAVVYGAVSLIILLGAGAFTWWQASVISARNEDLAIAESHRLAERIGSTLDQARQGIAVLAAIDPVATGSAAPARADCETLLNATHLTMNAVLQHISVLGTDGTVVCSTMPSTRGHEVFRGPAQTAELTGHPVTGALVKSVFGLKAAIVIAHPWRHANRQAGVVVGIVSVDALRETVARYIPAIADARIWLLDSAETSVSLFGPDDTPVTLPDSLRISFEAPFPIDAGAAVDQGRLLIQARATDELSLILAMPESAIRAGAPLEVALPPLLLAFVLLTGLGALFWSIQRFVVAPLEAATRRLEAPAGAPAEEEEDEAASDVADLIRRLGATRTTRDEAIRLRDMLLREAHHRIKNHLALVTSFLRLQERQLSDHAALQALRAAQGRMVAIGMTYEMLHDGPGQFVALDQMLARFARALAARDMTEGNAAQVLTDLDPLDVPADVAVKIGLVVNELATNALKYAFSGRAPGTVTITLRPLRNGGFTLCISDDGVGMPNDPRRGLGLTVVDSLLRGIDATMERQPGPGTQLLLTWQPRPSALSPAR